MEKATNLANQHKSKLPYGFLLGAAIGAFNCLTRPDYNLIVYLYLYYVWTMMDNSKVRM